MIENVDRFASIVPDDATVSGLQAARRHVARLEDKVKTGGADFAVVEEYRKGLNAIYSDTQPGTRDRRAVRSVIKALDDWLDDYPYQNQQLREVRSLARGLHAEERALYGVRDPSDAGGKVVEKIIETPDLDGRNIINSIFGSDVGSARQSAVAAVRRFKQIALDTTKQGVTATRKGATAGNQAFLNNKGAIPQEIQSLREAAVYRILKPLEGSIDEQGRMVTNIPIGTVRTNLRLALADDGGGPVMRELFTPEEIARMQRFQRLLEQMMPPPGTVNYSGTAYEGARMARDTIQRFVESTLGGGPAVVFNTIWSAPKGAFQAAAARQSTTRGVVGPAIRSQKPAELGAAYGSLQNQDDAYGP
jgi:hypothetical protein